ncbi:MAG: ribonuclease activity regulator RraA [Devosia sp.]
MDIAPIAPIKRPDPALVEALRKLGAATVAGTLGHMGIRDPHMSGPVTYNTGKSAAGPAVTLQMMPKREDVFPESEYDDPEKHLHRHVLYQVERGDFVVVDARGDMKSGIFGEMMLTFFKGRGGAGLVIDGCIRDYPHVQEIDLPMWLRGVTPNFHIQTNIMPFAVNVPVACGGVLVMPGDIIVADDDGAVCVPAAMAQAVVDDGKKHADWEEFSKMKLMEGGDLRRYYPLHPDAEPEYQAWRKRNPLKG